MSNNNSGRAGKIHISDGRICPRPCTPPIWTLRKSGVKKAVRNLYSHLSKDKLETQNMDRLVKWDHYTANHPEDTIPSDGSFKLVLGNWSLLRVRWSQPIVSQFFLKLGQRFTFQQDNDPRLTARVAPEWFNTEKDWFGPKSPDFNSVESLCQDLNMCCSQAASIQSDINWVILPRRMDRNGSLDVQSW